MDLVGGCAFLNAIAAVHRDGRAAYIARTTIARKIGRFYAGPEEQAYYASALWGLLQEDEGVEPVRQIERKTTVHFWEDSGVAHYRDPDDDIVLSVKCGPSMGYNAYRRAAGPCDRLGLGPDAGHFMIAVKGRPLLTTPDSGYSLQTGIRSCLLIDGAGQKDDIGYTMSVPSYRYAGEEIRTVHWDDANGSGRIRLDLTAAYPEPSGVTYYFREFIVEKGKPIVVRDCIALDQERKLTWLFQTKREYGVRIVGLQGELGGPMGIRFGPRDGSAVPLMVSVEETPVVWSYVSHSHFQPFDAIRYETSAPVRAVAIDFVFAPNG
ncbi:MAG: Heparinase II/III-like protein [Paenibacillus sp.]|nr:Heparinase II/III-like protein [Paenibacillus sp.]